MAAVRGTGPQSVRAEASKRNVLPPNPPEDPCEHRYLNDIQNSYNKATALYWADGRFYYGKPHSAFTHPAKAFNVIYSERFLAKGYNTDIEFNTFVAKTIQLQDPEMYQYAINTEPYQQTVFDVIRTHQSLCQKLADIKPTFETLVYPYRPTTRATPKALDFGVDEQYMYYRLRPLSRALIIFFENPLSEPQDLLVKLIQTGVKDGLSAQSTSLVSSLNSSLNSSLKSSLGMKTVSRYGFPQNCNQICY